MGFKSFFKKALPIVGTALGVGLSVFAGGASLFWVIGSIAVTGGIGILAKHLQPDPEGAGFGQENIKTTVQSTTMPARFIAGETQVNGLLTHLSQANSDRRRDIWNKFGDKIRAVNNPALNSLMSEDTSNQPIYATFTVAQHPCEALNSVTINGQEIILDPPLRGKSSRGFSVSRTTDDADGTTTTRTGTGRVYVNFDADGGIPGIFETRNDYATYSKSTSIDTVESGLWIRRTTRTLERLFYYPGGNARRIIITLRDSTSSTRYRHYRGGFTRTYSGGRNESFKMERNVPFESADNQAWGVSYVVIRYDRTTSASRDYWRREGASAVRSVQFNMQGINNIKIPSEESDTYNIDGVDYGLEKEDINVTVPARGGKVVEAYSNNPVGVARWVLENLGHYSPTDFDNENYAEMYRRAEDHSYEANGFFTTEKLPSTIALLARQMRGYVGDDGLIKMQVGSPGLLPEATLTINDADVANVVFRSSNTYFNQVTATFRNRDNRYQTDNAIYEDVGRNRVFQQRLGSLDFSNNKIDAEDTVRYVWNLSRHGNIGASLVLANTVELGIIDLYSILRINMPEKGLDGVFIVENVSTNEAGMRVIQIKSYGDKIFEGVSPVAIAIRPEDTTEPPLETFGGGLIT